MALQRGGSIVILTGAGISAESGLSTFRGSGGLGENHTIDEVATPEGFRANPTLVHRFYNQRRGQLLSANLQPNAAHEALAKLESEWNGEVLLVTQNVDNLHERARSRNILHMHGELMEIRCNHCYHVESWTTDLSVETPCPACQKAGGLRPNVVWFGEIPAHMEKIFPALVQCDLFLSIGTSGNVYPAAGFVQEAKFGKAHTVEINLEPSETESLFDEKIYGPATKTVPAFVERVLRDSP